MSDSRQDRTTNRLVLVASFLAGVLFVSSISRCGGLPL